MEPMKDYKLVEYLSKGQANDGMSTAVAKGWQVEQMGKDKCGYWVLFSRVHDHK